MGVVMERWCPTQQMLGVFLRRILVKKLLLIGTAALLMVTSALAAPDDTPYKDDGPKRDNYLQNFIRTCTTSTYWKNLAANEKETLQFCECKALFTADTWTTEDALEWERARLGNTKLPFETFDKMEQATLACKKHFSKLPKVPTRPK
jgi:hypothetical protein